ncbi:MAG: hypothetical protein ACREUE_04700, partial [Panacagrimonas sp.]
MAERYPRLDVVFVQAEGLNQEHGFDVFAVPLDSGIGTMLTRLRTHTLVLGGIDCARAERLSGVAARRGTFQVLLAIDDAILS